MRKIAVIGGGSGLFNLLIGLKKYDVDISAIVSVADSGGSSGILRSEFGILPPGDILRCLVALSDSTPLMKDLFLYRFKNGDGLKGHSFGNLFLTALREVTGSDEISIMELSRLLKIRGKVLPVSLDRFHLCAELENGQIIVGETNIDIPKHDGSLKIKRVFLEPKGRAYYGAVKAIMNSDFIILGPGDLYTSLIPNLLVSGISEAIRDSKAKKIYVCNLMTKFGETNDFKVHNFVDEIEKYAGGKIVDFVIVNSQKISNTLLEKYSEENAYPVELDEDEMKKRDLKVVKRELVHESNIIRHDSDKLAKAIIELVD